MRAIACAGAVIVDDHDRILLIRRGRPPGIGLWSVPGGRCEPDEQPQNACIRETREECGLDIAVDRFLGTVVRPGTEPDVEYVISDFFCSVLGGEAAAGDDAADVAWVSLSELDSWALVAGLGETLAEWGVCPALWVPLGKFEWHDASG